MTSPPRKLPGAGPEPLEVAAILGIGFGWTLGGIGTLVGFACVLLARRWTISQKAIAIAGPILAVLAPLVIVGASDTDMTRVAGAFLSSMILGVVASIASAVYLWFTLPDRDGSVG